jgi:DNA repair exonuclease SbcCD nuclease subunit
VITLVWRTDVHMADMPPQSRTDDWASTILGKLGQVGDIAKDVHADAVLDGGDFFHVKSPGRNSHEMVRRVTEAHASYPCPVYANIGNHDVKYGSMEYLSESPLAVLFESGVFKRCYDQHEAVFVSGGVKVRVVGIPYHGTTYDMNRFTSLVKHDEDHLVVIAHCLASAKGGTMFDAEDVIGYNQLANLGPNVWCFGHWHKNQGITEIARNKHVVNVGSLSRGSISQDDLARTPSCVVMRFGKDTVTFETVPLKVAAPADVFNLEARERKNTRIMTMDAVVDRLKSQLTMRESGSVLDTVREAASIPENIRERTIHYLERAGAR